MANKNNKRAQKKAAGEYAPPSNGMFIPMEAEINLTEWADSVDDQVEMRLFIGEFKSNPDYDWSEEQFEAAMREYHA
jgi:hypothetical protein